jgi:aconitate hydratase
MGRDQTPLFSFRKLPVSIRLVLESVLRNCDGKKVHRTKRRALANWKPAETRTEEIPFVVARIVLQDFTGVPLLVDLAAMRSAVQRLGKNPKMIEPLVPVDLVVDHSVQVDCRHGRRAWPANLEIEFPQPRALPISQMGHAGVRHLSRSCRPASASSTR